MRPVEGLILNARMASTFQEESANVAKSLVQQQLDVLHITVNNNSTFDI